MWPNFGRGDIVARMELHGLHTEDTPAPLPGTTRKHQSRVASNLNVGNETIKLLRNTQETQPWNR